MICLSLFIILWSSLYIVKYPFLSILLLLPFVYILIKRKRYKAMMIGIILIGSVYINKAIVLNRPKEGEISLTGVIYESKDNYFLISSNLKRYYVNVKSHPYDIGDILEVKAYCRQITFSTIESSFDFEEYLSYKGVEVELDPFQIEVKFHNPIRITTYQNFLLNKFSKDSQPLVSGIIFGRSIDSEKYDIFERLHLSRLITTSGIFINGFFFILVSLLNLKFKNRTSKVISFLILTIYSIFTFPRFAPLKIMSLKALSLINDYKLNKKFLKVELISGLGIFFLLIDPFFAFQDSFILGFSIPLILTLSSSFLVKYKYIKKKGITLAIVFLFFIPFELKFNQSISPLSPILITILSPLFIVYGFLSLLTFFGIPLYSCIDWFTTIILSLMKIVNLFDFSLFAPSFFEATVIVYYCLYFFFLYYLSIDFKLFYKKGIFILLFGLLTYLTPYENLITNEVSFINVGQGDACLIRNKTKSILIDTGGLTYLDVAKESLIPFFKKKRIYNLDIVITTHNDFDHNGGLNSLQTNFHVRRTINSYDAFPLSIGDITFYNYNNHSFSKDDNQKSLVIGFSLSNTNYLITGDADKEIENYIMKEYSSIPCDILKVGHHGSKYSTGDRFIKYLSPKEAVISVGRSNRYGHPHKEVLNILKSNKVKIRRTDLEGTISYKNIVFIV